MTGRVAIAALCVAAIAFAAVSAPLEVYVVSLALFGLPHVATELRYVDERFGARMGTRLARRLAIPLLGIALVRALAIAGVGDATTRAAVEWTLGAASIAVVLPLLASRGSTPAVLGALALLVAVLAVLTDPFAALVLFALAHNLTPLGFLAERLDGPSRRRAMLVGAVVFLAIPAVIVCGVASPGLPSDRADALAAQLASFVPIAWHEHGFAFDLFRAGAFLQCLHYAIVILVLPRLGGGGEASGACCPWPVPKRFVAWIGASAALFAVGYVLSFTGTRATYGVVAAIHAWLEIPVLLVACAVAPRTVPTLAGARA
ncbi:MAG: hypothetical protein HZB39_04405 [Planctomycetes bacterium]|nr:hypothetical protein [Planctomycetota bacterium]